MRRRTDRQQAGRECGPSTVDLAATAEYAFADAAEAHPLLESRTSTGKIVLRPDGAVG